MSEKPTEALWEENPSMTKSGTGGIMYAQAYETALNEFDAECVEVLVTLRDAHRYYKREINGAIARLLAANAMKEALEKLYERHEKCPDECEEYSIIDKALIAWRESGGS